MGKRILKKIGIYCLLLLFTAQTLGWCGTYVCECSGITEFTSASYCASAEHPDEHDHDDHSCPLGECESDHAHPWITASYSTSLPQSNPSVTPPCWVTLDLPSEALCSTPLIATGIQWQAGHDPGPPLSVRHRHTLAMLI